MASKTEKDRKVVIITGANAGIGKAAASLFVKNDIHVVMACRNKERALSALNDIRKESGKNTIEIIEVDMSLQRSIQDFVSQFLDKFNQLDVLVNNAAAFDITQKERIETVEGHEKIWATNHLGPFLLTNLLLETIKKTKNSRVINVSSKGLIVYPRLKVDFEDLSLKNRKNYNVQYAYYHSKLAQVIFTYELARQLGKDTTVSTTAHIIRVTNVQIPDDRLDQYGITGFKRKVYSIKRKFAITPQRMAETYFDVGISDKFGQENGWHIDENGNKVGSNKFSNKTDNWEKVWDLSLSQTSLK